MKHNQKITLAIGLGVVILLNILILGWLLTDFFSGPNGPEETTSTIDSGEVTTEEITTMPEESGSEEVSTEDETEPPKQVKLEVPLKDAKKLLHRFALGEGEGQLGYSKGMDGEKIHPEGFAVEDGVVYVFDNANNRILIYEKDQYRNIDLSSFSELRGFLYQNARMVVLGKRQEKDVLAIYRADGSEIMTLELPTYVTERGTVQDILKLDETSVVLEIKMPIGSSAKYSYDWVADLMTVEVYSIHQLPLFFTQRLGTEVIGVHENNVYYNRLDKTAYVNEISRESESYHLYTRLDTALHYAEPKKNEYLSSDGRLYVMECFADSVEISEIILDSEVVDTPVEPSTEETTTEEPTKEKVEKEVALEDVKKVIHTFSWGKETDQIGWYDAGFDPRRPRGFVVEGDTIWVWDDANRRILICEDDQYTAIETGYIGGAYVYGKKGMKYQNGWISLVSADGYDHKVRLYRDDGSESMTIDLPGKITEMGIVQSVIEIGDTYVVLEIKRKESNLLSAYRYDWTTGSVEWTDGEALPTFFAKPNQSVVIGIHEGAVYYSYPQGKVEHIHDRYVICKETQNTLSYIKLELSDYRNMLWNSAYLSTDGRLYIMEYFEDRVEISEIILDR